MSTTQYPASDALTIREHLAADGLDPDIALGDLPAKTLDRLVVRYSTLRDNGESYVSCGGHDITTGFKDVKPSRAFPELVFVEPRWPVYLDVDGKLHQSA